MYFVVENYASYVILLNMYLHSMIWDFKDGLWSKDRKAKAVYAGYVTERAVLGMMLFGKERGINDTNGGRQNSPSGLF